MVHFILASSLCCSCILHFIGCILLHHQILFRNLDESSHVSMWLVFWLLWHQFDKISQRAHDQRMCVCQLAGLNGWQSDHEVFCHASSWNHVSAPHVGWFLPEWDDWRTIFQETLPSHSPLGTQPLNNVPCDLFSRAGKLPFLTEKLLQWPNLCSSPFGLPHLETG